MFDNPFHINLFIYLIELKNLLKTSNNRTTLLNLQSRATYDVSKK